jgi:GDP-L-fucose synthase
MPATVIFSLLGRRVFVAGHRGMLGSALVRRLSREDCEILTASREVVDLRNKDAVAAWFATQRPQAVFVAAAQVGGIHANNSRPAEFLYDNVAIATNIIEAARRSSVSKLMFVGSSCVYPLLAPQPMPENCLLTGPLEPTSQWSAIAKIAGIKLCQAYRRQFNCDFVSVIPTSVYGPGDNIDLDASHVFAALMIKIAAAVREGRDTIEIWGTGESRREFIHVDDLADAMVYLMKTWSDEEPVNIGTGSDVTINELARTIAATAAFFGRFVHDTSKSDGASRKLLDVSKLAALGWEPRIDLEAGVRDVFDWYRQQVV